MLIIFLPCNTGPILSVSVSYSITVQEKLADITILHKYHCSVTIYSVYRTALPMIQRKGSAMLDHVKMTSKVHVYVLTIHILAFTREITPSVRNKEETVVGQMS